MYFFSLAIKRRTFILNREWMIVQMWLIFSKLIPHTQNAEMIFIMLMQSDNVENMFINLLKVFSMHNGNK